MELGLLIDNLTNPALLFFFLGLFAVQIKSDLEIPPNSSKFISLYLLFSIGFKGGQELAHSSFGMEIFWSMAFGVFLASVIPLYSFFILKRKFGNENSGAIAAAYGSISAVTFVTAVSLLDILQIPFGGHMVAVMAIMEAPAIVVGVFLMSVYQKKQLGQKNVSISKVVKHAFSNGSVVLIIGSLVIGFLANESQAQGIKPFTSDIFTGFLAVFLLDMGITSGRKLASFFKHGWFPVLFGILIPLVNGMVVSFASALITDNIGNRLLFAVLAASASYIAVPAAMKLVAPKANPGLYLPMALAVTFPLNITVGLPFYLMLIKLS